MSQGKVYLVGAGPGDPGLITVRGLECLKRADVVIYDYLASPELLKYTKEGAELIYMGKRGGEEGAEQREINRLTISKAKEGKMVVRLKGGDPFIFGRGGEEAEEMADAGIPFEVVPGVTSASAVPAYAGIPLTHRDYTSTVAFVTGHEDPTKAESRIDWEKLTTGVGTLIFLMGVGRLPEIAERLMSYGRDPDTPVAVIRWGTTGRQATIVAPLKSVADEVKKRGFRPPAIIIVGDVVRLRDKLNWFETKPLFGRSVLVTRSRTQASVLSKLLREMGAEPVEFPTIEIRPLKSYRKLDAVLRRLSDYHWLILTSANGVEYFFNRLYGKGYDVRDLKGVKVCAIGPATARALEDRGIRPDLVPAEYQAEGIIEELKTRRLKGRRILLARAKMAREILPRELKRLGAQVTVVPLYRTVKPSVAVEGIKGMLKEGKIDAITFTSSSTVKNFVKLLGREEVKELIMGVVVASIGPITAETARRYGIKCDIMAEENTIPALVKGLSHYFSREKQPEDRGGTCARP